MKRPVSSASSTHGWVRPGTASRLPFRRGIQNEWMTSREVISSGTCWLTGITSSLAVTMSGDVEVSPSRWYWNSHHHC